MGSSLDCSPVYSVTVNGDLMGSDLDCRPVHS